MKKFFAASLFLGLASLSQAAVITATCTGSGLVLATGATTNVTESCTAAFSGTVTGVTVAYSLDLIHTDNNAPASATYSFNAPGTSADFSGSINDGNRPVIGSFTVSGADLSGYGPSFSIVDTFGSAINVQAYNVGKTVTITYTPSGNTPEPSTFVMLGTALTGLGFFARRRKA